MRGGPLSGAMGSCAYMAQRYFQLLVLLEQSGEHLSDQHSGGEDDEHEQHGEAASQCQLPD